jgi:hypothetical protein
MLDRSKYERVFKQPFVYVLKATTKAGDFKYKELNDFFTYSNKDDQSDYYYMFMSLVNSVFTHMAKTFIISRSTLFHLCNKDLNNIRQIKVHANNYSTFLSFCFENGYLIRLREPTAKKGGVYQISDPDIVKQLNEIQGKMFFEEQEAYVIKAYDSGSLTEDDDLSEEDKLPGTKEERRAKFSERIDKAMKESK